jgi:hypothetical protein
VVVVQQKRWLVQGGTTPVARARPVKCIFMPRDENLIPPLKINSEPPESALRLAWAASTLRRTFDRATGTIETREEAVQRYREAGLNPPDLHEESYYEA